MPIKGAVEAKCPNGCQSSEVEVISLVRGDKEPELRDLLKAGELNLIICQDCGAAFYPEAPVVYMDLKAELAAFIFPESYKAQEEHWRAKMREDYAQIKTALKDPAALGGEPFLFFGYEDIRLILQAEDDMADEVEIAEFLSKQLGLSCLRASRRFARELWLPWTLPCTPGKGYSRERAKEGVEKLLKANDRLESFRKWLDWLGTHTEEPPLAPR
ncbi:MAG: CpXC domain-containing protein [Elusimicrobiota bacterium]